MSGIATAIIGGAIIGGVGSSLAAKSQADASKDAAELQADSAMRSEEMQLEYLREVRADIAEAVESGLIDLDTGFKSAIGELEQYTGMEEYNAARNLLSDPSAIMRRPGVQFQYDQGIEAMQAGFSRGSGGGISGPTLAAAQQYGQNFASQALDAELNRLFPFINMSNQASTNIANLFQGEGVAKANLQVGGAAQIAGATGQAVPSIASTISQQGNAAAINAINQGNITASNVSNISNTASDLLSSWATKKLFSSSTPNTVSSEPYPNLGL